MTDFSTVHIFKQELMKFLPEGTSIRTKTMDFPDMTLTNALVVTLLEKDSGMPTNMLAPVALFRKEHGPSTAGGKRIIF